MPETNKWQPSNVNVKNFTNNSAELVKEVRQTFENVLLYEKDFFDEEDVQKVREDDWFVKRFILARNRDVKEATKMLVNSLKWRKEENFRNIPYNYYPREFYLSGGIFTYEDDLDGCCTMYFRLKYLIAITPVKEIIRDWASLLFYKLDNDMHLKRLTVIVDFRGLTYRNADVDLAIFATKVLTTYFPCGLTKLLLVNLPTMVRFSYNLIRAMLHESQRKLIHCIDEASLTKFISIDSLPDFLGGKCKRPYNGDIMIPKDSPRLIDFLYPKNGNYDKMVSIIKYFVPLFKSDGINYNFEEETRLKK